MVINAGARHVKSGTDKSQTRQNLGQTWRSNILMSTYGSVWEILLYIKRHKELLTCRGNRVSKQWHPKE